MSGCSGWPGRTPALRVPPERPCRLHSQQHRVWSTRRPADGVGFHLSQLDRPQQGGSCTSRAAGQCPAVVPAGPVSPGPWPGAADGAHTADSQRLSLQAGRLDGVAGSRASAAVTGLCPRTPQLLPACPPLGRSSARGGVNPSPGRGVLCVPASPLAIGHRSHWTRAQPVAWADPFPKYGLVSVSEAEDPHMSFWGREAQCSPP